MLIGKRHTDVRHRIAAQTQCDHTALHTHPWIGRLASDTLCLKDYMNTLVAYHAFFEHVETARRGVDMFRKLTLSPVIVQLRYDLEHLGAPKIKAHPDLLPTLEHASGIPGALYVLHGSMLGSAVLSKRGQDTLPSAPRQYLNQRPDAEIWRILVRHLEAMADTPSEPALTLRGAQATFKTFGMCVSAICEAHRDPLPTDEYFSQCHEQRYAQDRNRCSNAG